MGNLTDADKAKFNRSGFIDAEINGFDTAVMPDGSPAVIDLSNERWKRVLSDREKFRHKYMKGGASQQQYIKTMQRHREKRIAEGEKNPEWEFLRADYGRYVVPSGKQPAPSDKKAYKCVTRIGGKPYWKDY